MQCADYINIIQHIHRIFKQAVFIPYLCRSCKIPKHILPNAFFTSIKLLIPFIILSGIFHIPDNFSALHNRITCPVKTVAGCYIHPKQPAVIAFSQHKPPGFFDKAVKIRTFFHVKTGFRQRLLCRDQQRNSAFYRQEPPFSTNTSPIHDLPSKILVIKYLTAVVYFRQICKSLCCQQFIDIPVILNQKHICSFSCHQLCSQLLVIFIQFF